MSVNSRLFHLFQPLRSSKQEVSVEPNILYPVFWILSLLKAGKMPSPGPFALPNYHFKVEFCIFFARPFLNNLVSQQEHMNRLFKMHQSRKGPVKLDLVTCAEHSWWCLHHMKRVCIQFFKAFVHHFLSMFFHQMIAVQKLLKVFIISPKKALFVFEIFNFL